jgi:hypothetical protein
VAKSSLSCVGRFGNQSADCWRRSLVGCGYASSAIDDDDDCGTRHRMQELFFSPFIFWSVHYPSVRSKSKERTSLSVVSLLLLLLPVKFVLDLLVYLFFFFSEHLFVVSIQIQFAYI